MDTVFITYLHVSQTLATVLLMEIIHTTNLPRQSGNPHHFSCLHEQPEIPLLKHLSQPERLSP